MLKVKVSRKKWTRGVPGKGRLYSSNNSKMCCLGFAMRAAGHKVCDIRDKGTPNEATQQCKISSLVVQELHRVSNSEACIELMYINDDRSLDETERESQLKQMGKDADIEFTFVD